MKRMGKLKQWIRQYGLWNVIARGFYEKSPIQRISPKRGIRECNWESRCKRQLKKYLVFTEPDAVQQLLESPNTIWWLWLQGADQAPEIVKKCLESVEHYAEQIGYRVVRLDANNLFEYVHLPEEIVAKWKGGRMLNAHFSDICRIDLVSRYGGFWIDSTVLLTKAIPEYIVKSDMFFFQASFLDVSETRISNWFLFAREPGNPFYTAVRDSLLNWWSHHDVVNDYFIFHLIVALLIESNKYSNLINKIPYYNNCYPTLLQKEMKKPFDDEKWNFILSQSGIHKLTYKVNDPNDNSYFHYILNHKVGEKI